MEHELIILRGLESLKIDIDVLVQIEQLTQDWGQSLESFINFLSITGVVRDDMNGEGFKATGDYPPEMGEYITNLRKALYSHRFLSKLWTTTNQRYFRLERFIRETQGEEALKSFKRENEDLKYKLIYRQSPKREAKSTVAAVAPDASTPSTEGETPEDLHM